MASTNRIHSSKWWKLYKKLEIFIDRIQLNVRVKKLAFNAKVFNIQFKKYYRNIRRMAQPGTGQPAYTERFGAVKTVSYIQKKRISEIILYIYMHWLAKTPPHNSVLARATLFEEVLIIKLPWSYDLTWVTSPRR